MDAVYHLSVKNNKGDAFLKLFSLKEGGGGGGGGWGNSLEMVDNVLCGLL